MLHTDDSAASSDSSSAVTVPRLDAAAAPPPLRAGGSWPRSAAAAVSSPLSAAAAGAANEGSSAAARASSGAEMPRSGSGRLPPRPRPRPLTPAAAEALGHTAALAPLVAVERVWAAALLPFAAHRCCWRRRHRHRRLDVLRRRRRCRRAHPAWGCVRRFHLNTSRLPLPLPLFRLLHVLLQPLLRRLLRCRLPLVRRLLRGRLPLLRRLLRGRLPLVHCAGLLRRRRHLFLHGCQVGALHGRRLWAHALRHRHEEDAPTPRPRRPWRPLRPAAQLLLPHGRRRRDRRLLEVLHLRRQQRHRLPGGRSHTLCLRGGGCGHGSGISGAWLASSCRRSGFRLERRRGRRRRCRRRCCCGCCRRCCCCCHRRCAWPHGHRHEHGDSCHARHRQHQRPHHHRQPQRCAGRRLRRRLAVAAARAVGLLQPVAPLLAACVGRGNEWPVGGRWSKATPAEGQRGGDRRRRGCCARALTAGIADEAVNALLCAPPEAGGGGAAVDTYLGGEGDSGGSRRRWRSGGRWRRWRSGGSWRRWRLARRRKQVRGLLSSMRLRCPEMPGWPADRAQAAAEARSRRGGR